MANHTNYYDSKLSDLDRALKIAKSWKDSVKKRQIVSLLIAEHEQVLNDYTRYLESLV